MFPASEAALAGGVAAGLAAGGLLYAGRWPTSQIFGHTLLAGPDKGEVALTFDDGPNDRYTEEILEFLANYRVRATFFMVGSYVRQRPEVARAVLAAGHLVGSHTMTHPNLMWQPPAAVRKQVGDGTHALEDTLGAPVRYFRPPYGGRRPDVLRAVRSLGLTPVLWNAAGYDWRGGILPEKIYSHLRRGIARNGRNGRGSNLLLHDGGPGGLGARRAATATAVPLVLHRLKRDGYRFVTVDAWG